MKQPVDLAGVKLGLVPQVRAAGNKLMQESGSAWEDIPADLAEGSVIEMLVIVNEDHDLDKVTATQIGQWMGCIDSNGEWL